MTFGLVLVIDKAEAALEHPDLFGVLLQQVGTTCELHDYRALMPSSTAAKSSAAWRRIYSRWYCWPRPARRKPM
ncbi:hypothetical protein [Sodalis-like endosymbiont of Proechinophthirus fluctus]|uniref:hypothetical protein n=1 Tax=Sodalis-like endosymbiont of Proechinophthirus fluctus TaxID=1462730 RepID=UPI000AC425C6